MLFKINFYFCLAIFEFLAVRRSLIRHIIYLHPFLRVLIIWKLKSGLFGGFRAMFAAWIWAVYFTFPGTYSTQPAVTTQVCAVL